MAAPAGSVTVPNRLPPSLANKIQPEKQNSSNTFNGVSRGAGESLLFSVINWCGMICD
jgi:hypothetical protein